MKVAKKVLRLIGGIHSIVFNSIMSLVSFIYLMGSISIMSIYEPKIVFGSSFGFFAMAVMFIASVLSVIAGIMLCMDKNTKVMAIILIAANAVVMVLEFMSYSGGAAAMVIFALPIIGVMIAFLCLKDAHAQNGARIYSERSNNQNQYRYENINTLPKQEPLYEKADTPPKNEPPQSSRFDLSSRIEALDRLRAEGKLTEEEYKELLRREFDR